MHFFFSTSTQNIIQASQIKNITLKLIVLNIFTIGLEWLHGMFQNSLPQVCPIYSTKVFENRMQLTKRNEL